MLDDLVLEEINFNHYCSNFMKVQNGLMLCAYSYFYDNFYRNIIIFSKLSFTRIIIISKFI